jgi:hypothetical protein
MKSGISPWAIVLLTLGMTGCATRPAAAPKSSDWRESLPPPVIDSVAYVGHEGVSRDTVQITGGYFDLRGDSKSDVLTSIDLVRWEPARKIVQASGTSYTAVVAHTAAFEHVYLRIYGQNGHYTPPTLISK